MQPRSRPNPKPSLTWGLVQVFALHNTHYRTSRPPAGFRCGGLPTPSNIDALTAAGITHGCATNPPVPVRRPVGEGSEGSPGGVLSRV